jgi:hypothetical protein
MGRDAIFLSNGHIDQLVESVYPHKIQSFSELGAQATTEMISFLGIGVCMVVRILTQVIESLCVLHYSAGSLSKS